MMYIIIALESSLFEGVELEEFLDKNWQKENKEEVAARLCSLSNHFNMVSLWVASVILSISSLRKQIKLMRRFIRICHVRFSSFLPSLSPPLLPPPLLL